ncbi:MAG: coenzyme F420-0:L-glutamate ligase [bacterium]|nr:coenzyme F420-0:L-glutamate ligase [bacterium]
MKIVALQSPVVRLGDDLWSVLKRTLPKKLSEKTVVVVTSKILSLTEGAAVKVQGTTEEIHQQKRALAKKIADWYIEETESAYGSLITIKERTLVSSSGVDASNADGTLVFWPENLQALTEKIWQWLRQEYRVQEVGVLVTDSHSVPLRLGAIGTVLAYCGFQPLNDKTGEKDLFGRKFQFTRVNVAEALAVAAVLEMGEGAEQTPVALVTAAKSVFFQQHKPTVTELATIKVEKNQDLFAPFLNQGHWRQGTDKKNCR